MDVSLDPLHVRQYTSGATLGGVWARRGSPNDRRGSVLLTDTTYTLQIPHRGTSRQCHGWIHRHLRSERLPSRDPSRRPAASFSARTRSCCTVPAATTPKNRSHETLEFLSRCSCALLTSSPHALTLVLSAEQLCTRAVARLISSHHGISMPKKKNHAPPSTIIKLHLPAVS
jgi:hypothetical protein